MAATGEVDFSGPALVCSETRLRWDLSPAQIRQMSDQLISNTRKVLATVGSLDLDGVTFNNTLKALADMEAEYIVQRNTLVFLGDVSPSVEVKKVSKKASEKLSEFEKTFMRMTVRICQRILALGLKVDEDCLSAWQKSYMEILIGESISEIKSEMESITRSSKLIITKAVARSRGRAKKAKKYKGKHRAEQIGCGGVLEELLEECALQRALQGFYTFADVRNTGINTAPSAETVSIFLEELFHKLKPLRDEEKANLLKLKQDDCQKRALPFDGKLFMEDLDDYMAQVVQIQYGVDHDRLKEYFPLEVVTQGLLDICQDLLGVSFSLVHGAPAWHPDVTLYRVTDRSSGQTVGQFYLDPFQREGKDMEACCVGYCSPLQPGCLLSDGSRQTAVAAIVTEFGRPAADGPCLLKHSDVETLFHEFGHAMHLLCAQVDYAVFNAFSVGQGFVEAPSQMLENWVWEKEPLQRISKHYKTGAPIPDDLLDKLMESRLANIGMRTLKRIFRAEFDQAFHTSTDGDRRSIKVKKESISQEYIRLSEEILGVAVSQREDITAKACKFFLALGHDVYRYLWAEVFSTDMFYSRFKQEGVMNPKVGLDFRNCILKPGASKDAQEMLKNFLGREPNQEAFLLSKGITVSKR